jgi:hypothetical protein
MKKMNVKLSPVSFIKKTNDNSKTTKSSQDKTLQRLDGVSALKTEKLGSKPYQLSSQPKAPAPQKPSSRPTMGLSLGQKRSRWFTELKQSSSSTSELQRLAT